MDLKITSEKIANPLLVDLLKKLRDSFNRMEREFYVIGATARDIIIGQLADITSGRKTRDLDIAIAIPEWSVFDEIKEVLIADGFKKSRHMHQRFYYGDYELDIVPYGVAKEDDNVYWPPEEDIAMSVKGFDEVLSDAITVNVDDEFDIKIASLHGLVYMEVYDWGNFDEYIVGGYWLARDLLLLLTKDQIVYYKDCIEKELEKDDESRLFNQIIEHSYGLTYETVKGAWQTIADVFKKAIEDEND